MTTPRPYILIVDDDPAMRYRISLELHSLEDHAIETAVDGADAIAVVENRGIPAVVVTDLQMPVMNGVQLVLSLRADARFQKVPIIVVSSDPKLPSEVTDTGIKLLSKGSTQQLLRTVKEAIHGSTTYGSEESSSCSPDA